MPTDSNEVVAWYGVALIAVFAGWRFIAWIRDTPLHPEPWSDEIEASLQQPEARPVCHRCLTPHPPTQWFCENCGTAVGECNNVMPYVYLFSQGEVLRNGVTDNLRARPLIVCGYLIYSVTNYFVLAPIYWFFLFKNLLQHPKENPQESTPEIP